MLGLLPSSFLLLMEARVEFRVSGAQAFLAVSIFSTLTSLFVPILLQQNLKIEHFIPPIGFMGILQNFYCLYLSSLVQGETNSSMSTKTLSKNAKIKRLREKASPTIYHFLNKKNASPSAS